MKPNNIGHIILEGNNVGYPDSVKLIHEGFGPSGKVLFEATLQTANERNRNGRWYSSEDLSREVKAPRTRELLEAQALKGEQGHPLDKSLERQTVIWEPNCSVKYLDIWMSGNDVKAKVTTTSNALGKALNEEILEGYKPAFSLRALGSLQQTKNGAEVHNLRVINWDQVIYPSHKTAYFSHIITNTNTSSATNESGILTESSNIIVQESAGEIIPITNESVINYIKAESSNIKFVRECFDFVYDSIRVNESGSSVILTTKEGDILVVNLERYIHKELMDYAASQKN